eukprot:CAMPEP_0205813802 /NCGR_PEP_ID=MMETSP0205-20121125/18593_1 /ASSEMBLY_ACC=CAM_ASM_000278 /TAXON_ID=36767 /ORGANISM="Euplotes focardii, Strain TN1" /LENGTH=160 /DNA_ID=CAMNT_0053096519 /DNA_START=294 /DNA_END=773 /DNA_ORIENTATION=+
MKNPDPSNMNMDMNSAINLLHYNNMVTVDSQKSKKPKKGISLKERASKNSKRKESGGRSGAKNDSSSLGNRVSDAYNKDSNSYSQLKGLNSNNSFGPEAYFGADLLSKNKIGKQFFTEGTPSVNESHSKDYSKSRNTKQQSHKSYNKAYATNPGKSPGKL